jgi:CBS domain containing-hemolysin-like protein
LLENDTVASALEVMTLFKSTKAFVVNSFGEVIGVVSIRNIAMEILKYERKMQMENYTKSLEEDKND